MTSPRHGSETTARIARRKPPALYGPRLENNPAQVYHDMREEYGPVAPVLLEGDVPAWLVLGYREAQYVTGNPHLFGRRHSWHLASEDWSLRPYGVAASSSTHSEGDQYRQKSAAVHDAITAITAIAAIDQFELRAHVERIADSLIDSFAGRGKADLIAQYTHRIPLLVLAKLFGLPDTEAPDLVRDLAISAAEGPEAVRANERIMSRTQRLVAEKKERPGPDMPSRLPAHPDVPSDETVATDLCITMSAAQRATSDWMGNALRLMLVDERFAVSLSGGRRSVGQTLNEVLWEETPVQNFVGRWATQDTQLAGRRIQAGDMLVLGLAAANTDPLVRPVSSPDTADTAAGSAGNQAYMSFSHGEHGCPRPAQDVAATIAQGGIEVLLDRLPDVDLAVPPEALVWRPSMWTRGLTSLPVEFTPVYVT